MILVTKSVKVAMCYKEFFSKRRDCKINITDCNFNQNFAIELAKI